MIPSVYPLAALIAVLAVLAAVILAPCLRAFRRAWFVIAAALAVIWAGDKPTPSSSISITLVGTTVSNVTISVSSPTNYIGRVATWQTRRRVGMTEGVPLWSDWGSLFSFYLISSTNETRTVDGRFVGGGKDTQLRLFVGDGQSNGVDL